MERRILLAAVLSIGLIFLVNTLFPPVQPPRAPPAPLATDTVISPSGAADGDSDAPAEPAEPDAVLPGVGTDEPADPDAAARIGGEAELEADTIMVRSELYEYALSTRGASVVGARLLNFQSYAEGDPEGAPVELVPEGGSFLGYGIVVGSDTVRLTNRSFTPTGSGLELSAAAPRDSLGFVYEFPPSGSARFVVTYHFRHDGYLIDVTGRVEGLEGRGYALLSGFGPGLRSNEKNRDEDVSQLAMVTNGEESHVKSVGLKPRRFDRPKAGRSTGWRSRTSTSWPPPSLPTRARCSAGRPSAASRGNTRGVSPCRFPFRPATTASGSASTWARRTTAAWM
jgi:YidC/Oxa1 family membrane protein insertase